MLNDRENILNVLREKPLKVYEIMKRANVVNEEACQSLPAFRAKPNVNPCWGLRDPYSPPAQ
jgi:hypothetical protein